ncbi:MAG: type II/IV secretion system ATPase subunit [Candidatus Caldarchaeum sp.]
MAVENIIGSLLRFLTGTTLGLLTLIAVATAVSAALVILKTRRRRVLEEPVVLEAEETTPPEVIDQYVVDDIIRVTILKQDHLSKYVVEEPSLTEEEEEIVRRVEQQYVKKGGDPFKLLEEYKVSEEREKVLKYFLWKNLRGGWKLEPLMRDEGLEDITITKPGPVYVIHRRHPDLGWIETNITLTAEELDKQARMLAERNGAELSIAKPAAEIMTSEGDRIALTYAGELTPGTSTITIRKFPRSPYTIVDLIRRGALTVVTAAYLWTALENKKFVMVAGPTGSGKTTLLSALLQLLPSNAKLLTLEDYHPEINLSWHKNWHRFVTRRTLGETAYSLADILRLSLRHRPDYTIVGEVRGVEARVMFSAAATGHGMASTIHAESLEDVYQRLTGAGMGVLKEELSFLNVVALVRNTSRGRRVVGVWEIERTGSEHLISWYDEESGKFFPETGKQLVVSSPMLVHNPALRKDYEKKLSILEYLVSSGEELKAEQLAELVEKLRKELRLVTS